MKLSKVLGSVAAGAALITGVGLSSAQAVTVYYGAATAWDTTSGGYDRIYARKDACGPAFTTGGWRSGSATSGSVRNDQPCYGSATAAIATRHPRLITSVRACYSRTALPAACSGYQSTGKPEIGE